MTIRKTLTAILGVTVMALSVGTFSHVKEHKEVHAADVKSYVKVTSAPSDWSGKYLIVYESGNLCFNGELSTLDATSNYKKVTISGNAITSDSTTDPCSFTIAKSGNNYSIKSASDKYIGNSSDSNGLNTSASALNNTISLNDNSSVHIVSSGKSILRYNATSGQNRFRYFKSGTYSNQKEIHLYKYTETTTNESQTLSTPSVTINAYTGVASWVIDGNAQSYMYSINKGEYVTATSNSVALTNGQSIQVKAIGDRTNYLDSDPSDSMTYTRLDHEGNVYDLLEEYYNEGQYVRDTKINIDEAKVGADLSKNFPKQNYGDLFHGSTKLERTTYFTPNALWMSRDKEAAGVNYSYYGTDENGNLTNGTATEKLIEPSEIKVAYNGKTMEEFYTTLFDIKNNCKNVEWSANETGTVYSTNDASICKMFLDFTAPCYYNAFSKEQLINYITLTGVSIEKVNNSLVLKLHAFGDTGKMVDGTDVLSQAVITKLNIASDDLLENETTISFANVSNRKSSTTAQQVWEENNITFVYDKAGYNSNLAEYANPMRVYAKTKSTISCEKKFKIIKIECSTAAYAKVIKNAVGSSATVSDKTVTIVLTEAENSFTFSVSEQTRFYSISLSK